MHRLPAVARDEVILPEQTLRLLDRNVLNFVSTRDQLRRLGQTTRKGILLYGPPGTGKTHTIRYLATHLPGHTTLIITAEQIGLLGAYLGLARLLQPSMVVIEDVDLIARDRDDMGPCEESMLNKLLNEMDRLKEARLAQASLARDGGNSVISADIDQALDDMLFSGGRLNAQLLGGAQAMAAG
ncbi:ATP-binding protein [Bradyrhizobium sp. Gha]|uniref:ATP-binding protein n=1 Tax=Bradyrhizobium sp. Gha TaxID=1855318 RepID=UPI0008EDD9F2|nr:ATP-binding protein [Bradyrhizobium sp. Gha]SFH80801.1 ATPase family associated with various cellular activities (AAA) [Bradyrhizobium sp. Gha]